MLDKDTLSLFAFISLLISIVAVYLDSDINSLSIGMIALEFIAMTVIHFVVVIAIYYSLKTLYYISRRLF
jgi:hypothetical protein